MPNLAWNKSTWDGSYDWSRAGDEWSGPWGSPAAMWFGSIMPRIGWKLPTQAVLEIALALGDARSSCYDLPSATLVSILSQRCVRQCEERFADADHAIFKLNDGRSLAEAPDEAFDLVFSFDSLVHVDLEVMQAYVTQICRKLKPGGVAFIHHSNLKEKPGVQWGMRSTDVSAKLIALLVEGHGGRILIQEIFANHDADCYSLFCRAGQFAASKPINLRSKVEQEAALAKGRYQHYTSLGEAR